MKLSKIVLCGAAALAAASCAKTARIQGTVAEAPQSDVVVKLLDVNTYKVLDTVKTDASGRFSYSVEVAEGQPEFVYVFYGDTKIASLVLEAGDKVAVEADTLGAYKVTGSEESVRLQEVEKNYSEFLGRLTGILSAASEDEDMTGVNRALSKEYVNYYRKAVAYVISNPKSITSVPVLFQTVNTGFPVFNQPTDAVTFRAICDSLKTVYPESKYVKALDKEAVRREQAFGLSLKISDQEQVSYPDIVLPDTKGQKTALSKVDAKVVLLYFWTASDAAHKMFNVDSLLPLYEQYHSKGFEIYSVAVDTDKATWAASVKNQKLPWINVCDGLGIACPALAVYNVTSLPASFVIRDGSLSTEKIGTVEGLKAYLQKNL